MIKSAVRRLLAMLGFRLVRLDRAHRFEAMTPALTGLRDRGFHPDLVIDVGANEGQWSQLARPLFPGAQFVLLEPQPACADALRALTAGWPEARFESVAVTEPGISSVRMIGADAGSTGAWVAESRDHGEGERELPATTLDTLLADSITRTDRALLKLDVERHEAAVLRGATRVLEAVEVVLIEAQLFEVNDNARPVLTDLLLQLRESGFELYDFASLSSRPRDGRLRMVDALAIRRDSPLLEDRGWP